MVVTDNTILPNRGPRTGGVSIWKTWTHKAGEGWAELYAFIHPTDYDFLNRKHGNCETPPLPAVKERSWGSVKRKKYSSLEFKLKCSECSNEFRIEFWRTNSL